jgi:uncharacterized protein YkwD
VKRAVIALVFAGLLIGTGCQSSVAHGSRAAVVGHRAERRIARDLLARVNAERAARGLRAVKLDPQLSLTAYLWSNNMAHHNAMYHSNLSWGHGYRASAENVAWYSSPAYTSGSMHAMWMLSAGHRRNILAPNLNRIGIGIACVNGKMWGTEQFGSTRSSNFGGVPPASPIVRSDRGRVTC